MKKADIPAKKMMKRQCKRRTDRGRQPPIQSRRAAPVGQRKPGQGHHSPVQSGSATAVDRPGAATAPRCRRRGLRVTQTMSK
jgi:hypothetical protein